MSQPANWALMQAPLPGIPARIRRQIVNAEEAIISKGYRLEYVDYVECPAYPGFLGEHLGVTDPKRMVVVIRTKGRTPGEIADTLDHEARHVCNPTWDCGNRDSLGKGGPNAAS